jgi:putative Holliday junction resolvase
MPYSFWDERLSTAAVERFYESHTKTRRKKKNQKKDIDNLASAFILEGALEYIKRN